MMKKKIVVFLFAALAAVIPVTAKTFNVKQFGAAGDGVSVDSPAINAAIAAAAKKKGSTVLVPAGVYKCFSLRLASGVTLQLEKGAVLRAAEYGVDGAYDAPEENPYAKYQDFGHSYWKNSLIWGIGLENVTLCGEGRIDGAALSDGFSRYISAAADIEFDFVVEKGAANKAIALKDCRNVVLKDITISEGGHFCVLASGVDGLTISGLRADSARDGIDLDCCKNVLVENCTLNTPWDDAIVMKSSYALGRYQDCENITIRGCHISGYAAGTLLSGEKKPVAPSPLHKNPSVRSSGRIKCGTESSGGFRNIRVSDCTLEYCGGLHVESTDGGSASDIRFENIRISDCTDAPVFVMIGARLRSPEGRTVGSISDVHFKNVVSTGARPEYGVIITGYKDHFVSDIHFSDCSFQSLGGLSPDAIAGPVPEILDEYPDPKTFGTMPCRGAYIRHAKQVSMENVSFSFDEKDTRPLMVRDDVYGFSAKGTEFDFPGKSYFNKYGMGIKRDGDKFTIDREKEMHKTFPGLYELPDLYLPYDAPRVSLIDPSASRRVRCENFVYKTRKDGSELLLTVDFADTPEPAPVIFQIHGGSWLRGSRAGLRDVTTTLAANYGITGVRVDYTHADEDGARMQDTIDDILDAVRFIRAHAAELHIDPDRVALMGQSAGAHLAAAAAVILNDIKVLAGFYGPYDGVFHFAKAKRQNPESNYYRRHSYYTYDYDEAYLKSISPLHLMPEKVNFKALLLQGTADISVNWHNTERFSAALEQAGSPLVRTIYYPGVTHFVHKSMYHDDSYRKLLEFLIKNL